VEERGECVGRGFGVLLGDVDEAGWGRAWCQIRLRSSNGRCGKRVNI
jgi:hypothetical protein